MGTGFVAPRVPVKTLLLLVDFSGQRNPCLLTQPQLMLSQHVVPTSHLSKEGFRE
jgi:hypothetical protein